MIRNIVVGISGGIDSAVTALLLKNKSEMRIREFNFTFFLICLLRMYYLLFLKGFNITGIFMKNWDIKDETGTCTVEKDYEDARWICDRLKIPLVEIDFVKEYWNEVFRYLIFFFTVNMNNTFNCI